MRIRPRPNLEVNRHFICDYGRMNYRWMNRGDRIEAPLVRDGGRHVATDWDTALARLDQVLRGATGSAVILASGRASTESLGLVRRLVDRFDVTAAVQVPLGDEAPLAGDSRTWRSGASGRPTWPAPSCWATRRTGRPRRGRRSRRPW